MASQKQLKYWESLKGKQPKNIEGLQLGHGWNKKERLIEIILCICGCGKQLNKFDIKGRTRESLPGHLLKFSREGFKKGHIPENKGTKGLVVGWNKGKNMKNYPHVGFQKGHKIGIGNQYNIGRKLTEEQKQKIAVANTKPLSKEKRINDRRMRIHFRDTLQKQIFDRDNYTCQMCGSKKDLQVDHIQSWKDYVELRFSMNNCRTLCAKCHYQITFGKPMPQNIKTWGHNLSQVGKEGY